MQEIATRNHTTERHQVLAKEPPSLRRGQMDHQANCGWRSQVASPRSSYRSSYGLSLQSPRSARGWRQETAASSDKFRRRQAKKEIIRRALTPPAKRPTLRWLDFRPTPSRLCNMSMA